MNRNERKLNKFIKTLREQGILDWIEKLQSEFSSTEVYLVGGAVRDVLLGIKDIKDLDFVVRNVNMEKLEFFLSSLGWVEKLGKNFGVLKFKPAKFGKDKNFEPLDIALPRSEFSTSAGGYKDFVVKFDKDLNLEQDLLRRDFTINAIAVNLSNNKIIDPFNGLQDINQKIIRCVGKPDERLSEDYTRILRAVRFSCQLNFDIESKTKSAIKKLVLHLNDKKTDGEWISPREVIAKEFLKALSADYLKAIELFDELKIFEILMPEILSMKKCPQPENFHSEGDVWTHTLLALKNMQTSKFKRFSKSLDKIFGTKKLRNKETEKQDLELIIAVLFHDLGKPYTLQTPKKHGTDRIRFNDHDNVGADLARKICERLKFSAPEKFGVNIENIHWLISKHMLLVHGHPSEFRPTTIEKYFFNDLKPGADLIKLAWLDISATLPAKGKLKPDLVFALLKRIKAMKSLVKSKKEKASLPEPFLDGNEIIKITGLPGSAKIGQIKNELREKQFVGKIKSKADAEKYLKEKFDKK